MGLPEIKLGLVPGYGGTQRLPRLVGESNALDIAMTGRMVRAEEGLSMGLVNRIVEGDPIEAGLAFAAELTGFSRPVLRLAREAVQRALDPHSRRAQGGGRPFHPLVSDGRCGRRDERVRREARAGLPRCLTTRRNAAR